MIKEPAPAPSLRLSRFVPPFVVTIVLILWLVAARTTLTSAGSYHDWMSSAKSNETCEAQGPLGTYVGEGDIGSSFRWRTTQTFYANGTYNIDQDVLADPLGVVPELHCKNVPFVTNEVNCTLRVIRNECMDAALNGMEVVKEEGRWDPVRDQIYFLLVVQVPRFTAIKKDLSYTIKKISNSPPSPPVSLSTNFNSSTWSLRSDQQSEQHSFWWS